MMKVFKSIGINLLVFVGLIAAVDFFSGLLLDSRKATRGLFTKSEEPQLQEVFPEDRDTLSNYKNIPWAKKHFKEFRSLGTNYESYYGWRRKAYKGETINIDSLGVRKTIGSTSNQAPTTVFLGGSTMWGTGVNDANTIPSLYSKRSKKQLTVFNYGESGYNAFQSLMFLQTQIAKGLIKNIDQIITYDGVNNTPSYIPYFGHAREKQIENALHGKKSSDNKKQYGKGYRFLRNTRILIDKIKPKHVDPEVLASSTRELSEEDHKKAAIELLESWLMMRKLAKNNEADFICILQPNIYVGKPDLENLKGAKPKYFNYEYYTYVTKYIRELPKYEVLKPHFIDMTNIFDNIPMVYIDWCHVTPNGNNIVVDHLLKRIN